MKGADRTTLLKALQTRFDAHGERHPGLAWSQVMARIEASADPTAALTSLAAMESTGGEPDVLGGAAADGSLVFVDCSAETPAGRRSLCFDPQALAERKEHPPRGSALGLAADMGVSLLTEAQYRELQRHGPFDRKTSSWLATPSPIRALGGALFGDRRYDTVFVYHNGAQSYYAVRGFRASLAV